jgi:hypothetical protein
MIGTLSAPSLLSNTRNLKPEKRVKVTVLNQKKDTINLFSVALSNKEIRNAMQNKDCSSIGTRYDQITIKHQKSI